MSSNVFEIFGLIIPGVLGVSWLVDTILSATWNKAYFTFGIPIFVKRIPVALQHSNIPSVRQLEARFYSTWTSSLVFKEIDLHTYGFREKFFEFRLARHLAIMHGILVFDRNNGEVVVKGFVNWFILSISLIWLSSVLYEFVFFMNSFPFFPLIALGFILFFIVLMGLLYLTQYYQFSKVAAFAAETWCRKYIKEMVGA